MFSQYLKTHIATTYIDIIVCVNITFKCLNNSQTCLLRERSSFWIFLAMKMSDNLRWRNFLNNISFECNFKRINSLILPLFLQRCRKSLYMIESHLKEWSTCKIILSKLLENILVWLFHWYCVNVHGWFRNVRFRSSLNDLWMKCLIFRWMLWCYVLILLFVVLIFLYYEIIILCTFLFKLS